jgi:hypothetical protein
MTYSKLQLATHVGRGLAALEDRPRLTRQAMRTLPSKLNPRDLWLLGMLGEHRVFTTRQITALAFDTATAARHRLCTLHRLRVLDRFRPLTPVGSAPWHYTLGEAGAVVLAAERGTDTRELRYRPDQVIRLAGSMHLNHTLAVNDFFVGLAAAARRDPVAELTRWWSENRCAATWGDIIRPDGYGIWRQHGAEHGAEVGFFAEIDLGTETLDRLVRKVDAYTELARASGIITPVLFHLTSQHREYRLHQHLGTPAVPVATTTADIAALDPTGSVWLLTGQHTTRIRLADLPPTRQDRLAG